MALMLEELHPPRADDGAVIESGDPAEVTRESERKRLLCHRAARDVMDDAAALGANLMRIAALHGTSAADGSAVMRQCADLLRSCQRLSECSPEYYNYSVGGTIEAALEGRKIGEHGPLDEQPPKFDPDGICKEALTVVAQRLEPRYHGRHDYDGNLREAIARREGRLADEARIARGEFNADDFLFGRVPADQVDAAVVRLVARDPMKVKAAVQACGVPARTLDRWMRTRIPEEHVVTLARVAGVEPQALRPEGCFLPELPPTYELNRWKERRARAAERQAARRKPPMRPGRARPQGQTGPGSR
jgi:hypothetical protein